MPTKRSPGKGKRTKKSSMKSTKSSSSGSEMSAWCVHERKPCTMVDAHKVIITLKNGRGKRALMKGKCNKCGKQVTKFVKM